MNKKTIKEEFEDLGDEFIKIVVDKIVNLIVEDENDTVDIDYLRDLFSDLYGNEVFKLTNDLESYLDERIDDIMDGVIVELETVGIKIEEE